MSFDTKERKQDYLRFMSYLNKKWTSTDKSKRYQYKHFIDMFDTKYISKGIEGSVYKSQFKGDTMQFVIKQLMLKKIEWQKQISKVVLNATQSQLYKLFLTKRAFNKPSMTELIAQTLTNQLVFQKICPHFVLNYYWDFEKQTLYSVNEFINHTTYYDWLKLVKANENLVINSFFQIMCGILAIQRYYGMLHTDLHASNILVHKVKPGGYWSYVIDDKRYYLPNLGYIILINDFGFGYIPNKLKPAPYHYKSKLQYITSSGQKWYDLQKLICELFEDFEFPEKVKHVLDKAVIAEPIVTPSFHKVNKDSCPYQMTSGTHHDKDIPALMQKLFYNMYKSKKHIKGNRIESYLLDKQFVTEKLPREYRTFINKKYRAPSLR